MGSDHVYCHTVDGSEIRRSPVEVGSLSHYLIVLYIPGGAGFLPSTAAFCAADGEHHFLSKSKRLLCRPVFTSSHLSQSTCLCCVILACSGHANTLVSPPDDISHPALTTGVCNLLSLYCCCWTHSTIGQVYDLTSYCYGAILWLSL